MVTKIKVCESDSEKDPEMQKGQKEKEESDI